MNKTKSNLEVLYFYGHTDKLGDRKCLSNWYPCQFTDKTGFTFSNTEQYMMYYKALLFDDLHKAEEILATPDPKKVKKKGREVKNFDQKIWNNNAKDIVYEGCLLKFSQNDDIKHFLLSTGNKIIAEASPYDKIWGIGIGIKKAQKGSEWNGTNWLGECLMKVQINLQN